jgi:glyoxylate reductase
MRSKRPFVIVTRKLPDPIETRMMELFACRLNLDDTSLSKPDLIAAVERADVLVPTVTDRIDAEVLEAAGPALKLIASFGTGVDHVDLAAAQRRGIIVTNTPGVLTEDTADMTMALILAVSRRLAEGERLIRSGRWTGWGPTSMLGHRIWGKRLGIVGMGRIGMALARRAKGFGLSVHYHNRRPVPEEVENALEATHLESLDQMLAHMDIVSVNCPHTPQAILVNTARGEIVDEEELLRLLETRAIAGAGLDVFEHEPAIDPRLRALDNVVLLPHMGSATIEGRLAMGEKVIINIKTFADGHRPPDRVLGSML